MKGKLNNLNINVKNPNGAVTLKTVDKQEARIDAV
jgi:hypothetical protein